ncbi:MAG: YdiU family protein [Defluviitaleaceae bacterium]|nr:YdiU family protein [Defluviitaleaceae bacterium]
MENQGWNLTHSYTNLPQFFYRSQNPEASPAPEMVIFNHNLAQSLGLDSYTLENQPGILAGSALPHGAKPISQAYAGFQFGHFAMLGDGRAVLLGEQIAPTGSRYDIQLKGSGPTPFSRNGDGYAALLPMLREYIISEAMFYLGIPTTRSLAVALTGKTVYREKSLKGAVLTRVASSHIRVGTFNYAAAYGTKDDTRALADYSIQRHFPHVETYAGFLREVAKHQASLIASWQLTGFVHGVMNTDNMAISGETIDYGPCAFMDTYDPGTVFSSIDTAGRYAYQNQPKIGAWNLARLAESLLPLLHEDENKAAELANAQIAYYWENYNKNWLSGMQSKLGIANQAPCGEHSPTMVNGYHSSRPLSSGVILSMAEIDDTNLISYFLGLMAKHKLDYTNTFRTLSYPGASHLNNIPGFSEWHAQWQARLSRQGQQDTWDIMQKHNPATIPRNHQVEAVLSAADNGDFSVMHNLLEALHQPYKESAIYSQPPEAIACGYKTYCGT